MAASPLSEAVRHLRRAVLLREDSGPTDGQLLGRFLEAGDEAAFEALVHRLALMVWGVCRRVLADFHDAEDAFQATFLVLVRRAHSIAPRDKVGSWLYGVAYHTAQKARATAGRRRTRERQVAEMPQPQTPTPAAWCDVQPLLDGELNGLPEKYRLPIVLCDLEGKSHQEAARHLGCPVGTVSGRLSRARVMLADRLRRRGVALAAGPLALLLTQNAAPAGVSASLLAATVKAAGGLAAGNALGAGLVSTRVAALTEGVLKAMLLAKLKLVATGLLVVVLAGLGAGVLTHAAPVEKPRVEAPAARAPERAPEKPADAPATLHGRVVAVSADGKTVTLEMPATVRGQEPRRQEIKLTDKTDVFFEGVRPGEAKPAVGQAAGVVLQPKSSDTAARARFVAPDGTEGARLRGKVVEVSVDGKTVTVEYPVGRGPNPEMKMEQFKISEKTQVKYAHVAKGKEKPTVGYLANVWPLAGAERGDPTAGKVLFVGLSSRETAPVQGKLVAAAPDGSSLTVETAPQERGGEPGKIVIKVEPGADVTYHGVGPDEAKPTAGLLARVWLQPGSKDVAMKVLLVKARERGR